MYNDRFFNELFKPGDVVNIRGFGSDVPVSSQNIIWSEDGFAFAEHLDRLLEAGANAGFGVSVRKELEGSGGAENLLHTRAVWVDIDDPDISAESIDQRAEDNGYRTPHYIIRTGGGVHLYWILDEPHMLDTQEARRDFSKRLKLLTQAFEGDEKCCEPARIMRAPGTPNMKSHYPEDDRPQCHVERFIDTDPCKITQFRDVRPISQGGRNNAVFNETRRLRDTGVSEEQALPRAVEWNHYMCVPALSDHEVETIVSSVYSRAAGGVTHEVAARFPEAVESEVAAQFVRDRAENLRFNDGLGWMFFNGRYWERDDQQAMDLLRRYLTRMRSDAGSEGVDAIQRLCTRLLTFRKIKDTLALAATMPEVQVRAEDFDNQPFKVNFENCTVVFEKDGSYRREPHNRNDYLTSAIPADFNDSMKDDSEFARFLHRIFDGDTETILYLQKRLGMALMGNVGDSKALILYGDGANGKSVLAGVLQECLGEYCYPVPSSTLTGRGGSDGGGETKVASLQGKRVGLVHEFGSATQLNDERFKMLTGGEALISGRHLYGRHFSFRPVTAFVIMSNYLPSVQDHSHGLWRRMALINFPVQIPEAEQDRGLMRRLVENEREFILYWLIEGLAAYLEEGAEPPVSSMVAMEDYKQGEDAIGSFLQENYEAFEGGRVTLNDMYQDFHRWTSQQGLSIHYSKINFGRLIANRFMPVKLPGGGLVDKPILKEKVGGKIIFSGVACKGQSNWAYDGS